MNPETEDAEHLNPAKAKLARGDLVTSMTVRLVASVEIVALAKAAGFDCIYIDLEHSSLSMSDTSQIAIAGVQAGLPCFVRVPANRPEYIGRVLDGGALGVIAPGVTRVEEAREVVAAAKFAPAGSRGVSGGLVHLGYGPMEPGSFAAMNAATLVAIQIEDAGAVEICDDLLSVEGIDMVLLGANDLLADMGIPGQFDHPSLDQAYDAVLEACRKHGKTLGIGGLSSRPDLAAQWVRKGGRFVSTGTDTAFLLGEARRRALAAKELARE